MENLVNKDIGKKKDTTERIINFIKIHYAFDTLEPAALLFNKLDDFVLCEGCKDCPFSKDKLGCCLAKCGLFVSDIPLLLDASEISGGDLE